MLFQKLNRMKGLLRIFSWGVLFMSVLAIVVPIVYAQSSGGNEEKVVNEFADFMIKILSGPVSKIIATVLLLSAVVSLLKGNQGAAIACAVAFLILMFVPQLIKGMFK